jgi:hypothetical protein
MTRINRKLNRRDLLKGGVFTGLAALGAFLFGRDNGWMDALEKTGQPDWQITIDGQLIQQGRFIPGLRKDLHIPVKNGMAHIVLDGNRILVHEDNDICPKRICSLMGSITRPGESIVCLPNKLVIRVL